VSYKSGDVGAARLARRLATRAAFKVLHSFLSLPGHITYLDQPVTEAPTLVYSPTVTSSHTRPLSTVFPYQYSLYPFLPPRTSPWLGNGRNLFRLRRVGEWLSVDAGDNGEQNGDIMDRCGIAVNLAG